MPMLFLLTGAILVMQLFFLSYKDAEAIILAGKFEDEAILVIAYALAGSVLLEFFVDFLTGALRMYDQMEVVPIF